ncbi:MAG: hypothetical protein K8R36_05060 [Planctomycetales bacterium]|nr:hypothetical protein [Planctomycetales bacterium]
MTQMHTVWKRGWIAVLSIAALGGASSLVIAADSSFIGSQSCNSVSCHGRAEPRRVAGGASTATLHEFALFTKHDPHAAAAKTLVSPEFQAIVSRLSEQKEGSSGAEVYRQCAQCHDPEGIAAAEQSSVPLLPLEPGHGTSSRGISCESCHGGAKNWLATHYHRDVSRSSLVAAGMRDTKDLRVRAEMCASCHVGDRERNVSHDMLAAGHPPLRFELAAYHRKLTSHGEDGKQSHWNDARERIGSKDFEVKLWEAGQVASAKAALTLLEGRAHRAALVETRNEDTQGSTWPEFAEYDCFGCHHRLGPDNGNRKSPAAGLPATVELQAGGAKNLVFLNLFTEEATTNQLLNLLQRPEVASKSWDRLCQRYLAQRVAQKSIGDEFKKLEIAGRVSPELRLKFNNLRQQIDGDLASVAHKLSFVSPKSEWPRILADSNGFSKVESDLTAAAGKLRELQNYVEQDR